MKTKHIAIERNLLDIGDIEEALSAFFKRTVSIGDVECTLAHCVPLDTETPSGAYLDFKVENDGNESPNLVWNEKKEDYDIGDDTCSSFELFWDEEKNGHYLNGKRLSLDEPWLPKEEIFSFDVSAFKSFKEWTDSSD